MATFRGEPLATVKCLTNDLRVPADAEMVRGHILVVDGGYSLLA